MKIFHPPVGKFCRSRYGFYNITLEKPGFLTLAWGLHLKSKRLFKSSEGLLLQRMAP